jgi:tRNA pseudouridine55 synthase
VNAADGFILVDKPAGITSHDVVASVRRALGGRRAAKVGHAGTLDPFATGLLVVLVGRATRVQRFVMELRKTYETVARFGWTSTTGDPDGELVQTGVVPSGELVLPSGLVRQRPPAYSAVKVSGQRAYALARAGVEVELPEREVTIYRFEETWRREAERGFVVECSSGTYIRSLVMALGDAYCASLRRTRIGPFDVADADPDRVIPLAEGLSFLPEVALDDVAGRKAGHGRIVPGDAEGVVRLTDSQGLIALAEPVAGGGGLRPIVGFRG